MKKIIILLSIITLFSNLGFSQLVVQDTILLAFNEGVFWSSSSELEMDIYADFGKYGSTNLGDSDSLTCWAEGSNSDGSNEFVWMTIPANTTKLKIRSGYQKSEIIYNSNNRPKNIKLELFACYEPEAYVTESHNGFFISESIETLHVKLKDQLSFQDINLNFEWANINSLVANHPIFNSELYILKLSIIDVYKGNKWNDACISDIDIIPVSYFEITLDEQGLVKVYEDRIDTVFYDQENIFQIVEISPELEWIIFILMPADIENSRVETVYKLFNTKKEEFIIVEDIESMYGFIELEGKLYLEGTNKNLEDKTILLEDL